MFDYNRQFGQLCFRIFLLLTSGRVNKALQPGQVNGNGASEQGAPPWMNSDGIGKCAKLYNRLRVRSVDGSALAKLSVCTSHQQQLKPFRLKCPPSPSTSEVYIISPPPQNTTGDVCFAKTAPLAFGRVYSTADERISRRNE